MHDSSQAGVLYHMLSFNFIFNVYSVLYHQYISLESASAHVHACTLMGLYMASSFSTLSFLAAYKFASLSDLSAYGQALLALQKLPISVTKFEAMLQTGHLTIKTLHQHSSLGFYSTFILL